MKRANYYSHNLKFPLENFLQDLALFFKKCIKKYIFRNVL